MESPPLCLSRLPDGNMSGISKEKSRGDFAFTCLMPIWRGFPKRGLKNKERPFLFAEADSFPRRGSQKCGLNIRLLFCGNDGQRFLRSDSCRTRKSTYAAARALPFSESLRKLSISSDSAPGKVASTRFCRCGSSVSLNISSTETSKKRERRNKADAVASWRPFSDFAIADRLSPVALANYC